MAPRLSCELNARHVPILWVRCVLKRQNDQDHQLFCSSMVLEWVNVTYIWLKHTCRMDFCDKLEFWSIADQLLQNQQHATLSSCSAIQESLANAKVNVWQHCVVQSHWNAGNAIWRTTMFHVVAFKTCEITRNSENIRPYSSSRSTNVIDLGVNGKPICDFLLVINSNFSRIWYRFRDIDA